MSAEPENLGELRDANAALRSKVRQLREQLGRLASVGVSRPEPGLAHLARGALVELQHHFGRLLGEESFCLYDAGAARGLDLRWSLLGDRLKAVAFEPDQRSLDSVARDAVTTLVPSALAGRDGRRTFFKTRKPTSSSLLRPNRALRNQFPNASRADVLEETTVECLTIATAVEMFSLPEPDFLKLDTQGSELEILQGAKGVLGSCVGVAAEVQFQPLYEGAPPFREIDAMLAAEGFLLFDLKRTTWRRETSRLNRQAKGQLIYGDALYFRDPAEAADQPTQLKKLLVALLVYGYRDVALQIAERSGLGPEVVEPLGSAATLLSASIAVELPKGDRVLGAVECALGV